jgi:hypothetical protein
MRSNNKSMKATSLRNVLVFLVLLTIAIAASSFYFGRIWLHDYAVSVNHTVANATSSKSDVSSLKKLQADIEQQQAIISKSQALFTDQTNYQTQVVQDVSRYASQLGLPTPNFSFQTAGTTSTSATSGTKTPATSGNTVTVALQSPIAYNTLLKFIMAIEQNLPKMQITGINIGRSDSSQVTTDALTIQVFSR